MRVPTFLKMKNATLLLLLVPFFAIGQVDTAVMARQVDSLIQDSWVHIENGEISKAIAVNTAAEELAVQYLSKGSAAYGSVCHNYGRISQSQGKYSEAEKWFLESKSIREKVLGKEHPDYVLTLNRLGTIYDGQGNYESAEKLYQEVKAIREKTIGLEHPDFCGVLINLGNLYWKKGAYEKSESHFLEAKNIFEKKLNNREHPFYMNCLEGLGILYYTMGTYEKAEPLYLIVKDYRAKKSGKKNTVYANLLNNLGVLYWAMGNYEKTEPLYREAITIWEETYGDTHPYYATGVHNLAILYDHMGNYERAEEFSLKAKAIAAKAYGNEHPNYAYFLIPLANFYKTIGDYEKAETFILEALVIFEKKLGKNHNEYAKALGGLASLQVNSKNYEKAVKLYLESMSIIEKNFGKQHPDYALGLKNMGEVHKYMGNYREAEQFYLQALAIQEEALGKEHFDYAGILEALGVLYQHMGNYSQAESFFLEAQEIIDKTQGKEHFAYAENLGRLAVLYWRLNNNDKSGLLFAKASNLEKSVLLKASRHLSEKELSSFTRQFIYKQNQYVSFAQLYGGLNRYIYDNTLFYKGFLLNANNQMSKLAQSDSASTELFYRLKSYHRRLASEYAKPIAERQNVAELEEKANALEKELARTVAGFGDVIRQIEWQEVRDALRPGEAAVEFVHYNYYDPDPTDSVLYAALVLRPGDESPQFIPLFEEKQLHALFKEYPKDKKAYLNQLYGNGESAENLYQLIWQPLYSLLQGTNTVYASSSGLLHRLNLGAIMVDGRHTFADQYQLSIVGSTRQLAIREEAEEPKELSAVIYGGIQYDFDSTAIARSIPIRIDTAGIFSGEGLSFKYIERSVPERGRSWDFLPGTAKEADEIQALIAKQAGGTEVFKGYSATEESFKKLGRDKPSPRILHLATHGYFFPDPAERRNSPTLGGQGGAGVAFKISHHPMIRSGLVMAGGNQAWRGKPIPEGLEDGILTAYEVSQADLRNTELVILSACETGLGDIEGDEGVYGLQRAFKIAGADKLIMSLWAVPDAQTQEMMVLFYKFWLEEGMEISRAFQAAQQEMRKRYEDHYYWAAFVLIE
ncbi:MAG: CHAT domain-containing protein [Lewinellaceae bacterium]|nr:CHAT domain-containing protein [Lewinellaceae bacterium]